MLVVVRGFIFANTPGLAAEDNKSDTKVQTTRGRHCPNYLKTTTNKLPAWFVSLVFFTIRIKLEIKNVSPHNVDVSLDSGPLLTSKEWPSGPIGSD